MQGTRLGGYILVAPLGVGSSSDVWLGRTDSAWAPPVALKILRTADPAARSQLRQEAALLAGIDHPHALRFVDLVEDGDDVALVMAYARGGSLADRVRAGAFDAPGVVQLLSKLCGALEEVHGLGLVHGDITAANVLFTSGGHPLLGDFGVAGWAADAWSVAPEATDGYAPPERLAGGDATAAGDVYSLAVTGLVALGVELLTGQAVLDVVDDLVVSSPFARLLRCALADDVADRFPSARSLSAALARLPEAGQRSRVARHQLGAGPPGSSAGGNVVFVQSWRRDS